mmetsp:Transcript_47572/g.83167  ORF Transcript_47572/g.83167 Transcript_47572/m.83167 type:complete len:211 (+) Transcript_47572:936-1568(+)
MCHRRINLQLLAGFLSGDNLQLIPGAVRGRLDDSWPLHVHRDVDATLEQGALPTTERMVGGGQTCVVGATIVAGEDHNRVVVHIGVLESLQHLADTAIQRLDHGRINSCHQVWQLLHFWIFIVGAQGLVGIVRGVVGQVEEERVHLLLLPTLHGACLDQVRGVFAQIVGHVLVRLEERAIIVVNVEAQHPAHKVVKLIAIAVHQVRITRL